LAATGDTLDRFEQEQKAFFERVRHAYLDRVVREPKRIFCIDATKAVDEIKKTLEKIVVSIC